jgi:UDP-N-acetylmuramoyl-L-alanyl-D-glutamate--2,6-diaminopimelate ligase
VRLAHLIRGEAVREIDGDTEVEITGISCDSREIRPGAMFFSLARDAQENRAYLTDALGRGARAVVLAGWDGVRARPATTIVECERPRRLMGVAASRFYGAASERLDLIGVTGTSGKTTTTYLLGYIFEAAGLPAAIIGTTGILLGGENIYHGLTTPEAPDFESALARMERAGVGHAFAEISSIGLAEGRVDALNFRACLFTNLGRDHLDYHGTLEAYFAAKLRLFTELLPQSSHAEPLAVVRGDDPWGRRVLEATPVRKLSFGMDRVCDVHPLDFTARLSGLRATLSVLGRKVEIASTLVGEINLLNILAACALSGGLGIEMGAVAEGVRRCPGAPGRMQAVSPAPRGVVVIVDYAHKPDALEAVLTTVRRLGPRRLICVFGCGGDRDRGKRPVMGEIAGRLADIPILTSDNPRTEDPLKIIAEIEAGLKTAGLERIVSARADARRGYLVESDRRSAIALALGLAARQDIVIIAGKGHEDYQLVGNRVLKFDDRQVVREIVSRMGGQ